MDRNSFLMYVDSLKVIHELTNEQAGVLFKAIAAFQEEDNEELDSLLSDFTTRVLFIPFKTFFERDISKYNNMVEKRKESGKKGGIAKAKQNVANVASATKKKQNVANVADSDSVSDSVSVSTNVDEESRKKDSPKVSLSDRNQKFKDELVPFVEKYGKDMIFAFFDYWSEPNTAGTKMKFEMQKTWSLAGRLRTWERRSHEKR